MCTHGQRVYWRYFLCTPRKERRKLRTAVHNPSMVLIWTSRMPSHHHPAPIPCGRGRPWGGPLHVTVPLPFIGVALGRVTRVAVHVRPQHGPIRVLAHPQATAAALAPDRADHRRAIILIGAVPPAFVGPPPRRITQRSRYEVTPYRGLKHSGPHSREGFAIGVRRHEVAPIEGCARKAAARRVSSAWSSTPQTSLGMPRAAARVTAQGCRESSA
jgi:hypothetical protein